MKKYLLILLWLPLFGQVPNTTTFNFIDVKNEIESNGGATTNSLVDAFANANAGGFDPAYEGSKNSLLNFRNYSHISGLRPSGDTYDFTAQETVGRDVFFKPDGTKMYISGASAGSSVYQYTLSTAWDVSTASYDSKNLGSFNNIFSLFFKPDGTKVYITLSTGVSSQVLREYTLSTAWDVSTASFAASFSYTSQDTKISGLYIKPDGTSIYATGETNASIFQYTLSTAWSVSTMSYSGLSENISSQTSEPNDVFFKTDGTKMYVVSTESSNIYEYNLSTAWNVSTATINLTNSLTANIRGLYIKSEGENWFFCKVSTVEEYITDFPWSIED